MSRGPSGPSGPFGWPLAAFGAALLALLGLRLALVAGSGASLHVDEAQYWDWSRTLQWGYYSKPPAVAVLIRASTALFGHGEVGLRALAMASYALTAAVLWALGRDVEASLPADQHRHVGIWAAAVFAASPIAGLLGLVATTDALLLLFWALALWALWRAVAGRSALAWVGFALACGFGLLDKYTLGALLLGAALFVWRAGDRRAWMGFAGAALCALLIVAPNLLWNAEAGWPTLRHTAEITVQQRATRSLAAAAGEWLSFTLAQPLILAPLLLPALAWRGRRWRGGAAEWPAPAAALLGWTSLPLAAVGLLQAARSHAEINWIAPVHLAAALALALALAPRPADGQRRWAGLLAAQLVLVTLLAGAPIVQRALAPGRMLPATLDAWGRMRGWPAAYAELARALPAEGPIHLLGTSRTVLAQAAYQWRDRALLRAVWRPGSVANSHYELSCPWRGGGGAGPWWVLSEGEPPADLAAALGGLETVAAVAVRRSSTGVIALRLSRPRALPPASGEQAFCR
ncbi:Glycosyltransferase family 39 protein [Rubrivivax sp. A210]|uniref:ArnT family glycosyltransferase n=1 Tax=Rubrivivax sp. A210 TaxID=2772301 RepID=UPI00191AE0B0|nr:glycosyltransferase family 39 protein [Rubrivivax sp. A210]CAD5370605.1 Glycosyltransferase family 39 protein [Rubrivivax sp. A210]